MEFQSEFMGIRTIRSTTKPSDFAPRQQFDFIWVASLFTHLPKRTFLEWLGKLYSLLTSNGVLTFSVHDTHLMPAGVTMPGDGHFFQPITEIPTLETSEYGASVVTPDFVASAIKSATGRSEFKRIQRALNFHQDVYVVSKAALPTKDLIFAHTPYGSLDHCVWVDDDTLLMSGWALDYTWGHRIKAVEIYLNEKLISSVLPALDRPDIVEHSKQLAFNRAPEFLKSGWNARVIVAEKLRPFHDIILAKAISTSGMEFVLRSCALNTILTLAH